MWIFLLNMVSSRMIFSVWKCSSTSILVSFCSMTLQLGSEAMHCALASFLSKQRDQWPFCEGQLSWIEPLVPSQIERYRYPIIITTSRAFKYHNILSYLQQGILYMLSYRQQDILFNSLYASIYACIKTVCYISLKCFVWKHNADFCVCIQRPDAKEFSERNHTTNY